MVVIINRPYVCIWKTSVMKEHLSGSDMYPVFLEDHSGRNSPGQTTPWTLHLKPLSQIKHFPQSPSFARRFQYKLPDVQNRAEGLLHKQKQGETAD